jgi:hypothetical protein
MKKNITKKLRKKTLKKGGFGPQHGLPPCPQMSLFQILDNNILSFRRYINSGMDCFINALQVFGLLDEMCANIMRISSAGRVSGFSKEEIEAILILLTGYNFDFTSSENFAEFESMLTHIQPNFGILAGYSGHVFVIARNSLGELILIDPQLGYLGNYEAAKHLINKPGRKYYILFQSLVKLTPDQLRSLGFVV